MHEENDQVRAWKDVEARDGDLEDHPAGKVSLPGRVTNGRAAILSGYLGLAVAAGVVTNNVPTIPQTSWCCAWTC
ncbi:hypothetical protein [Actinophytocola sediminis]